MNYFEIFLDILHLIKKMIKRMLSKIIYRYETKPKNCPVCGSEKIADILYGYPLFSDELKKT